MIRNHGINDMPKGWRLENEENERIYRTYSHMLERCYSEKLHKKYPTYKNCTVCERWLLLSNFVEDFYKIDGYDKEKFLNGELCLDKDIKSNGQNKEYSLENCIFVSNAENVKQSNKTMDYSFIKTGENSHMYGKTGEYSPRSIKIAQYDKEENLIKIWNGSYEIQRELGTAQAHIIVCCKFWEMNCDKEEWYKTHKNNPRKLAGGYIWKYYKGDEEDEK